MFQKTILMGRPSRWRTCSRSPPSAPCSPALLVPNAPETRWGNGWPVRSGASARAALWRNCPITSRRRLVSLTPRGQTKLNSSGRKNSSQAATFPHFTHSANSSAGLFQLCSCFVHGRLHCGTILNPPKLPQTCGGKKRSRSKLMFPGKR